MTTKKTSQKKAAKATKATQAKTTTKTQSTGGPETTVPAGECPRGGNHEWVDAEDGRHCTKCFEPGPAKVKRGKAKAATGEKRLSAIAAAAKVLGETNEPLNAKQMIDAIAAKGYWTSPGGKTPHATLYSALLREIATKGKESRFKKTDRGHFTRNG